MNILGQTAILVILLVSVLSNRASAHGEDRPGPHGGAIRMPGAFHTELIVAAGGFKVLLLDLNLENPTNANSTVEIRLETEGKTETNACAKQANFFFCAARRPIDSRLSGKLKVRASRYGSPIAEATYELPIYAASPANPKKHRH